MAILLHGTTRDRAELIAMHGPDPDFVEPGGGTTKAEGFSTYLEAGPFLFSAPEEYACGKAALFPNERGAAILAVDVPDDIIALAVSVYFPLSQGIVQFDPGAGLEELRTAWPMLLKEIRSVPMSTASQYAEQIRTAIENPRQGIVGLVDDVLMLCGEHALTLDWQQDRCRVRCAEDGSEELIDVSLPKSAFRAVLARVATLCNERVPKTISPYGGQGNLTVGGNGAGVVQATFVNTPVEQRLTLTADPLANEDAEAANTTVA